MNDNDYPLRAIVRPGADWVAWIARDDETPGEGEFEWRARQRRIGDVVDAELTENVAEAVAKWARRTGGAMATATMFDYIDRLLDCVVFELAPGIDPETGKIEAGAAKALRDDPGVPDDTHDGRATEEDSTEP